MALVLVLVAAAPDAGLAQPAGAAAVPQSREQITLSFAPLAKRAAPAVVNIYTRRVVRAPANPFFNDPFFRRFFGENAPAGVPRERIQRSLGSGVIVRPDGLIVTSNHVIKGAEEITVVLADRREYAAEIVSAEERTDLAVLRIAADGAALPYLALRDSDELEVGDLVLAIGNPFGVGQTVTSGIVSALARTTVGVSDFSYFIQTDAAINPGNSGGALIGMDGRLIGINSAIYSRGGGSVGIGFAIPSNMVATVIQSAMTGTPVRRPWLGATGQAVNADIAQSLGLARPEGVLINRVYKTGPAADAGLRVGDVVLSVNGQPVDDLEALRYRIATLPAGATAQFEIMRGGQKRSVDVVVAAPPENPPRNLTELSGKQPLAGATVANLSPALAEEMRVDPTQDGVIVVTIRPGTTASRVGTRIGDVVLEVNGKKITLVEDLVSALRASTDRWRVSIRRGDKVLTENFSS